MAGTHTTKSVTAADRVTKPMLAGALPAAADGDIAGGAALLRGCAREEETIRELHFEGLALDGENFRLLGVVQCRFVNCSFQNCSFEQGSFSDVEFKSCDFSNCDCGDSFFGRCRFLSCKGLGTKFAGSTLRNLLAKGSAFDFANFDACRLERVRFEECRLKGAVFSQCRVKDVSWDRAQLSGASFFKTSLRGMDFTTSEIDGLTLSDGCEELRGAVVDLYQAAELSKRLGLVIK